MRGEFLQIINKNFIYFLNISVIFLSFFIISTNKLSAQNPCNSGVPFYQMDLTGNPDSIWISPNVARNDNCCSTTSPDRCIGFLVTLDSNSVGINFHIVSGAIPSGALYYQIDCGPIQPVGEAICLEPPGLTTLHSVNQAIIKMFIQLHQLHNQN